MKIINNTYSTFTKKLTKKNYKKSQNLVDIGITRDPPLKQRNPR